MDNSSVEEDEPTNSKCFTVLQSRNLSKPLPSVGNLASLCSSMDLIAFGLGSIISTKAATRNDGRPMIPSVESIYIHRTLSWQRLLVLGPSELSGSTVIAPQVDFDVLSTADGTTNQQPDTDTTASLNNANGNNIKGATCLTWSADGRALAVGLSNGQVLLFQIESMGARLVHATARATFRCTDYSVNDGSLSTEFKGSSNNTNSSAALVEHHSATKLAATSQTAPPLSPVLTRSRAAAIRRQQLLRQKNRQQYQKQQHQQQQMEQQQQDEDDMQQLEVKHKTTPVAIQSSPKNTRVMLETNILNPQVVGLCWAKRIARPIHLRGRQYGYDDDDHDRNEAWMIQCRYLNRASHFLSREPWYETLYESTSLGQELDNLDLGGSNSSSGRAHSHLDWNGTSGPPSALAPLSVLCVAGAYNSLSLYLHGRYRIATVGPATSSFPKECSTREDHDENTGSNAVSKSTQIVCSLDLSGVLLVPSTGPMILYDLPQLSLRHHELSWIGSSFSFVAANVYKAYTALDLSLSEWRKAIRPLETLISSLHEILHQYGVVSEKIPSSSTAAAATVRSELLSYMTLGHCTANTEGSAEACLQFFGSLSEYAIQRMAKTVESGVVAVENKIRSSIQASGQGLVYSASELYGLARTITAAYSFDSEEALLDNQKARLALEVSERLCIVTEHCLVDITRIRHNLRDFFAWMVGEVLSVKAEGTAFDAPERQQAISKRPPQAVRNRVATFLSDAGSLNDIDSRRPVNETECLVGIRLSEYFTSETVHVSDSTKRFKMKPSLRCILLETRDAFHSLFASPREIINRTTTCTALSFSAESDGAFTLPAAHKRFSVGDDNKGEGGGFRPNLLNQDHSMECLVGLSRNWLMLAQCQKTRTSGKSILQIVALPSFVYDEDTDGVVRPSYYLTSFIELPKSSKCDEVFFYGDDGNSSLSVTRDANDPLEISNPEGRQSLGLLVEVVSLDDDECRPLLHQELWLVPYDELRFKIVDFKVTNQADPIEFKGATEKDCIAKIIFRDDGQEHNEDVILCAKKRRIRVNGPDSSSTLSKPAARRIVASGSRGVVGIVNKNLILTLLDVEEEEDVEVSDEDDSMIVGDAQ